MDLSELHMGARRLGKFKMSDVVVDKIFTLLYKAHEVAMTRPLLDLVYAIVR